MFGYGGGGRIPERRRVRDLTEAERAEVRRLAHSRTEAARLVEWARIIWLSAEGRPVTAIAAEVSCHAQTARLWLTRFNAGGVAGLADAPRPGCPATYTPEQIGAIIAVALTDPRYISASNPRFAVLRSLHDRPPSRHG